MDNALFGHHTERLVKKFFPNTPCITKVSSSTRREDHEQKIDCWLHLADDGKPIPVQVKTTNRDGKVYSNLDNIPEKVMLIKVSGLLVNDYLHANEEERRECEFLIQSQIVVQFWRKLEYERKYVLARAMSEDIMELKEIGMI